MVLSLLHRQRWFGVFLIGGLAAGAAFAQASAIAPAAAPAASAASTSVATLPKAATVSSAFEGYKPYTDEQVDNWKAVNDTVGKVGGWREYAKQSRPSSSAPVSAPAGKAADPVTKSGTPSAQPNPKAKP